jgi:hypothetical protein
MSKKPLTPRSGKCKLLNPRNSALRGVSSLFFFLMMLYGVYGRFRRLSFFIDPVRGMSYLQLLNCRIYGIEQFVFSAPRSEQFFRSLNEFGD